MDGSQKKRFLRRRGYTKREREREKERKRIYARTICPTPSYWPVLDCVHGIFERL